MLTELDRRQEAYWQGFQAATNGLDESHVDDFCQEELRRQWLAGFREAQRKLPASVRRF